MTVFPEAKLAREAEICYASICAITDYDCWKEECVTGDMILKYMQKNVAMAKKIIKQAVSKIPAQSDCECTSALKAAIVTSPTCMTLKQMKKYDLLIGKYLCKK